jgi:hypothetical protein
MKETKETTEMSSSRGRADIDLSVMFFLSVSRFLVSFLFIRLLRCSSILFSASLSLLLSSDGLYLCAGSYLINHDKYPSERQQALPAHLRHVGLVFQNGRYPSETDTSVRTD